MAEAIADEVGKCECKRALFSPGLTFELLTEARCRCCADERREIFITTKVPGETADDPPEFELHLDVDAAKSATLGVSPKTGGPIARILGADGAPLLTLLPAKDSAFVEKVVGKFGEEVTLERAAAE